MFHSIKYTMNTENCIFGMCFLAWYLLYLILIFPGIHKNCWEPTMNQLLNYVLRIQQWKDKNSCCLETYILWKKSYHVKGNLMRYFSKCSSLTFCTISALYVKHDEDLCILPHLKKWWWFSGTPSQKQEIKKWDGGQESAFLTKKHIMVEATTSKKNFFRMWFLEYI